MGEGSKRSNHTLTRLLFWEGLAFLAFLYLLHAPLANHQWEWIFFYNSLFFLAAYPLLYVYRWKMVGGCLGVVMWPLSFVLDWALGISAYLWTTYGLLVLGSPYFHAMMDHPIVLGALFLLVYFPLIQPLWGVNARFLSLGELTGVLIYAVLGGTAGFFGGWFVDAKLSGFLHTEDIRFPLWLGLILLFGAAMWLAEPAVP